MRTELQRQASRTNGARSKGPSTPGGRQKVRFNGLKHGLRAEQVVLPGENAAEFEAERKAWLDDWKPRSHTRAVLCERAASASWRLRRSVRAESARLRKLANAAAGALDAAKKALIDRALTKFETDPAAAVAMLQADPSGIDQLLAWWGELAKVLAGGPAAWDSIEYHNRLMVLLGHDPEHDPEECGPMLGVSYYLLASNDPEVCELEDGPYTPEEAAEAVSDLLELIDDAFVELRKLRARFVDPSVIRQRAIDAALVDDSAEARLLHRYEMAHDRSLRSTINQLIALDKSGADRAGAEDDEAEPSEIPVVTSVASPDPGAPSEPEAGAVPAPSEPEAEVPSGPAAPTEPEPAGLPTPSCQADHDRDGRIWPVASPVETGLPS